MYKRQVKRGAVAKNTEGSKLPQLDGECDELENYQCSPYSPDGENDQHSVDLSDLDEEELALFHKHCRPYCSCENMQQAAERVVCGIRQHRDYNTEEADPKMRNGVIRRMLLFLLRNFKNAVVLAHYGSRFDFIAVVEEALHSLVDFKVIQVGRKMLRVKIRDRNITFLDFYNYTNQSLNKVCSSLFGNDQKDIFPHAMNRPWYYHLNLKHLPYLYEYEMFMKTKKDQVELEKWHRENYNNNFSLHDVADEYCLKDTVLLQKCALQYTKTCLKAEACLAQEMTPSKKFQKAKAGLWIEKTPEEIAIEEETVLAKCRLIETYQENLEKKDILMCQVPEAAREYIALLQKDKSKFLKKIEGEIFGKYRNSRKVYPTFILPFTSKGCTVSTYANVLFRKYCVAAHPRIPICLNESAAVGARASSQQERTYMAYRTRQDPGLQSVLTGPQKIVKCGPHSFRVDGFIPDR